MRYFIHIAYDGSSFSGWQRQPNVPSVQETIEIHLANIFKRNITVYGCGRTDRGVHSSQYWLHIQLTEPLNFDLKFRLSMHLPNSITVFDVIEAGEDWHTRYDAIARSYDYFLHFKADPILSRYSSYYPYEHLNYEAMKKCAELIERYNDFRSFCLSPDTHNHTECEIQSAKIYVDEENARVRFAITANRFLKGMIRILVWDILRVGKGEQSLEDFEYMLKNPHNTANKKSALPNGLYLSKVVYPYLDVPPRQYFLRFLLVGLE